MTTQIAHLYATGCLAIVFFQIALIGGAPLGRYTQGGRYRGALPLRGRLTAAAAIPALVLMGLAIVSAAGFPGLDWPRWTGWAVVVLQTGIMILNWMTPSQPERAVWGPITTIMAALALVVMTAPVPD
ncbi:hypothetical protein ACG74X_08225 [Marivita sp. S0852]|uniref:hypothetical protein n=1 Tax=Marivita sp. S0852 TaxID=3373893 RepID=UPI00398278AA